MSADFPIPVNLSRRERQVCERLLAAKSHKEIAELLGISQRTVRFHSANILHKFGVSSQVELLLASMKGPVT